MQRFRSDYRLLNILLIDWLIEWNQVVHLNYTYSRLVVSTNETQKHRFTKLRKELESCLTIECVRVLKGGRGNAADDRVTASDDRALVVLNLHTVTAIARQNNHIDPRQNMVHISPHACIFRNIWCDDINLDLHGNVTQKVHNNLHRISKK